MRIYETAIGMFNGEPMNVSIDLDEVSSVEKDPSYHTTTVIMKSGKRYDIEDKYKDFVKLWKGQI